jgi:hypothetical protein
MEKEMAEAVRPTIGVSSARRAVRLMKPNIFFVAPSAAGYSNPATSALKPLVDELGPKLNNFLKSIGRTKSD